MEFKDKVIHVRKELILSQQELADALGVNVATINLLISVKQYFDNLN